MEKIKIYVPLNAVPMERPRVFSGRAVTPKRSREFMNTCKDYISAQYKNKILDKPLKVDLHIFKKKIPTSRQYGDVDNIAKSILDSMTGIVYKDDSLVVELSVKKYYSSSAGIIITLDII